MSDPAPLSPISAPAASLDLADWLARRDARRALAEAALTDPRAAASLLGSWQALAEVSGAPDLLGDLSIPDAPEIRALVGWLYGPAEGGPAPSEAAWDRRIHAAARPLSGDDRQRRAAALYLIARLGEEVQRREIDAWRDRGWEADDRDARAAEVWAALLADKPVWGSADGFRALWGELVEKAFVGVSVVLRLPAELGQRHAAQAREQLDFISLGAHLDIASRVVEQADEPILALGEALGAEGLAAVRPCLSKRVTWSRAFGLLGAERPFPLTLSLGSQLAVLLALIRSLEAGAAPSHDTGLPAWGVVKANRSRMRGRLRAVCRMDPGRIRGPLLSLGQLYQRTRAAVGRYAWAWAWREARSGFGFDAERAIAPPCVVDPRQAELHRPMTEAEERAVATFLLMALGRGCWEDVLKWLEDAPTTELSKSFYRCLRQAPEALADPMAEGQRVRRYSRLQEHLKDGGLDHYLPLLRAVARRVAPLSPGRGLKAELHEALGPDWDEAAMPLPSHHLPTFCRSYQDFGEAAATGVPAVED